jgi:very-short-patch-repair endonuclease
MPETIFLRLLAEDDKAPALAGAIAALRNGDHSPIAYAADPASFQQVPGSPFAYWVSEGIRRIFINFARFNSNAGDVRIGLSTKDDLRFLRCWWEVKASSIGPFSQWVPFAKGGSYSPFQADIHLLVKWERDGEELKDAVTERSKQLFGTGGWSRWINSVDYYFRPGLTYPRRTTSGLSVRVMPAGCIFADKGPAVFVPNNEELSLLSLLAIMQSEPFSSLLKLQLGAATAAARSYEVGLIQQMPVPPLSPEMQEELAHLARQAHDLKREQERDNEVTHPFTSPALARLREQGTLAGAAAALAAEDEARLARLDQIQREIDERAYSLYGFAPEDRAQLEQTEQAALPDDASAEADAEEDEDSEEEGPHPQPPLHLRMERGLRGEALRALCRELRQKQTPAEALFWELVRDRRFEGYKFRRQHPLGTFIADFYCSELRLVVELDGGVHATQAERDQARDEIIAQQGIRVVRIQNAELLADPEATLDRLAELMVSHLRWRKVSGEALPPLHPQMERGPGGEAAPALAADLLMYAVGCAFGRWDARIGRDRALAPPLADPFAPLPVCAPGALVGPDGLPARSGSIVSEAWLRARPDAITLPPAGSVAQATIPDKTYPLPIAWDGILADDPDHEADIVRRVRAVLELLWGERADAIEAEACGILGVRDLRDYFRNARSFFDHHIGRYSKSRRKAPIYWLLQSPKKQYGLWLYYHRLDPDLLFKALTLYVQPKIRLEESRLHELRAARLGAGDTGPAARQAAQAVERQEAGLSDLRDFHDRLERAAKLYLAPDLNDGVLLNIAPLWELVPWKEAKSAWEQLLSGKYGWSSIGKQLREKGLVKEK